MKTRIIGLIVGAALTISVVLPQLVTAEPLDHISRSGSSNCNPYLPIASPQPPRPCR